GVFDSQHGHVALHVAADIYVLAVGAPHEPLGQAAHLDFGELGHLLAVDLEDDHAAVAIVVPGIPGLVAATQEGDGGEIALGADRLALGSVAHHHPVDDAWRRRFEIDDADRVDIAVGAAGEAVVDGEGDASVGNHVHVVWPEADRHVVLVVGHLLAIHVQHGDLVAGKLGHEGPLAVGGEGDVGDLLAHGNGVYQLHLLAGDGEHACRRWRAR